MESGSPADACFVPLGAGAFLPGPWQAFMKNSMNGFEEEPEIRIGLRMNPVWRFILTF
jgi:hypothetical protein